MTQESSRSNLPVNGLLGRKIEMMQWFDDQSRAFGVTLVKAGPCVVTSIRTPERDGYTAVQLGLIEKVNPRRVNRPLKGHLERGGAPHVLVMAEFKSWVTLEPGRQITVFDLFSVGDLVDVTSWSKGRGFQGTVRRHGFQGGPASHGSKVHRKPGSIGQAAWPARVFKGVRMAGRMGPARVTTRNLRIAIVDPENHVLGLVGSIPGARNQLVHICHAKLTLNQTLAKRRVTAGAGD